MTEVNPAIAPIAAQAARPATSAEVETAREFEAMFLSQTVDQMLKTVPEGMLGGGHAEEMWRSFLARAIADEIASGGRVGVAQSVEAAIAGYNRAAGEGEL
jgi:flagellar protein FlgJ